MTAVEHPTMPIVAPPTTEEIGGDTPVTPFARRSWWPGARTVLALVAVLVGVAGMVTAGLVAVAPVVSTTSTLSWPPAGGAPDPTTAFLVPYRPAALAATVGCPAIRGALDAAPATGVGTTLLATTADDPTRGLVVRVADGTLEVLASGRSVRPEVGDGDCTLRVTADTAGVGVRVGDGAPRVLPGDPVPEVFAVTTDVTGTDARGLALTARTPAWFDHERTPAKDALIRAQLQLAAVALGLLVLLGVAGGRPGPRREGHEPPPREAAGRARRRARAEAAGAGERAATLVRAWRGEVVRDRARLGVAGARRAARWAVDVVVVATLVWWAEVGPWSDDDGFAAVIADRAARTADVGNYYRWFNASEAPFASSQQVLAWFAAQGPTPVGLRTAALFAGIALWLVVTRGVLGPALGAAGRTVGVRVLTALALGAWWLPHGTTLRPEPLVALGTAATLAVALRAVSARSRHPRPLLGLAVLVASSTVTVAPTGLLALAPLVLVAPRLWRRIRGDGLPALAGTLAASGALAAVAVTVVFARQSWHGLTVSTAVHRQIGPNVPWYAEWMRYENLVGDDSWGSATKRLPVVLGLVLAVAGIVLLARRGRGLLGPETTVLLGVLPAGFLLLAVTPSKWSHHFGALAGFGAVTVVAVVVAFGRVAREDASDPALRVLGVVTALGLGAATAFAFSGPNAWWGYANIGMPGATGPVTPFDDPLVWWALAAGLAVVVAVAAVLRGRRTATAVAGRVPALVAVAVLVTSVGLLVSSFAAAADRGPGLWSPAGANRAALADPTSAAACGIEDRIEVLETVPAGPPAAEDGSTAELEGFAAEGYDEAPPERPDQADGARDGQVVWGSRPDGDTGRMTTPWFPLRRPAPGQELAVDVEGRTDRGLALTWEFARGDTVLGALPVVEPPEPERGYRGYAADATQEASQDAVVLRPGWRTVTVAPGDVPEGTDRVRLRAVDGRADTEAWVALTGPRTVDVVPLRDWFAARSDPVLVNWTIAFGWPCRRDLPSVTAGVAETPGVYVTGPEGPSDVGDGRIADPGIPGDIVAERWLGGLGGLAADTGAGASFAGVEQAGTLRPLVTRLAGEPARRWGQIFVADYDDLARDRYDRTTDRTVVGGTQGDPPPASDARPRYQG